MSINLSFETLALPRRNGVFAHSKPLGDGGRYGY
ncbi:hypothetical protein COL8621_00536 [Actibacterium lipolyticum]|uniref:Uncharacterized protein n=1 Tax=Actibacterium lipolyticum TaxID=1524263 RepID=A0A238JLR8_9RHOB|nr:hypothetical protein COL8621_00536 [Actibacterium lipolyticum]